MRKLVFLLIITMAFTACSSSSGDDGRPTLTGTVSIIGYAEVEQTLMADTTNLDGSGTISYQWKRGTVNIGTNSMIYTIVSADVGSNITVTVTRQGYSGSVTSPAIGPIIIDNSIIHVTFNSVTADGSSSQTTTVLTLTFSQVIIELTADDINLSGVSGVQKGNLTGTGPVYTLPISGFTAGGTLNVVVTKLDYAISGSFKTVGIYYIPPTVITIDLAGMNEWQPIEQTVQITSGQYIYLTVIEDYVAYQWYLDGEVVEPEWYQGDVYFLQSFIFYFNKPSGVYQLAVVVTNSSGESRSGRCRITVTDPVPDGSEAKPFPLTINSWFDGNINSFTRAVWYSFRVNFGVPYYIFWSDKYSGDSKTLYVKVSATYNDGTSIFNNAYSGSNSRSFTANQTGTVKIMVVPYDNYDNTGTFAVCNIQHQ